MAKPKPCGFPNPKYPDEPCGRKGFGGWPVCEAHHIVLQVVTAKILGTEFDKDWRKHLPSPRKVHAPVSQSAEEPPSTRGQ